VLCNGKQRGVNKLLHQAPSPYRTNLGRSTTHSDADPQPEASVQRSSTDIAGLVPPPEKKSRPEDVKPILMKR